MRRSILLVLVAALMLTLTVGATASVAAGPGVEAQAAARRGRRRAARCPTGRRARRGRRAARCRARRFAARRRATGGGGLASGFYEDEAKNVTVRVTGTQARVDLPVPSECPLGGVTVGSDGILTAIGDTARANGVITSGLGIRIDWQIVVRPSSLAYTLDTAYLVQIDESPPCAGSDRVTGRLVKQ
ncbi:MAG TPA: hypothetical protein VK506_10175 [Conexibacter sp.]|nr:hypothetical protein [Conexibacter sp.]